MEDRANNVVHSAYIIHQKKYSESSLIIDFFTEKFGIVSVLAKGALKKKSPFLGVLKPFLQLNICYSGRSQLKTLVSADISKMSNLTGLNLYCGFYINELISLFVHPNDENMEIFHLYQSILNRLSTTQNIESELRFFELDLLEFAGYGLDLDGHVEQISQQNCRFIYVLDEGLMIHQDGYISCATLQKLAIRAKLSKVELIESKLLMRHVLDTVLQGREIKSRQVIANMNKYLQ